MFKVLYTEKAIKSLRKIDKSITQTIISWINKNLEGCDNPRLFGKSLKGNLSNFWRYRIGDYRILATIEDQNLIIHVVNVGHRKEVYR